jgi:hypothetical protein
MSIAEKFLAEADTDGDGKISASEAAKVIIKIEKAFVSNVVYAIVQAACVIVVYELVCFLVRRFV